MKLKSSIEFAETLKNKSDAEYRALRNSYDHLLKQPLTLGMFVPVDEEGKVLEKPNMDNFLTNGICRTDDFSIYTRIYHQAKERVLFEGFISDGGISVAKSICQCLDTIEALAHEKTPLVDLTLTPNAIKQIGL